MRNRSFTESIMHQTPQHPNRVKNTPRGHSSISVRWPMYRGRGAGRWAESSSGARGLPYKPPACRDSTISVIGLKKPFRDFP